MNDWRQFYDWAAHINSFFFVSTILAKKMPSYLPSNRFYDENLTYHSLKSENFTSNH